jgi:hypothetical protein
MRVCFPDQIARIPFDPTVISLYLPIKIKSTFDNSRNNNRRLCIMDRFLVEVPHEAETVACARAVEILLKTGSHFLSHAEWGCMDGVHKGWIILEAENKEQARNMLPPAYRHQSTVVKLNKFTLEQIDQILMHHTS